jgi:hypothetical protein
VIIEAIEAITSSSYECKRYFQSAQNGYDNFSLLHYAAKYSRTNLCEYLIEELGIDVDTHSKTKMTPLHVLIKSNIFNDKDTKRSSIVSYDNLKDFQLLRVSIIYNILLFGYNFK